MVFTLQFITFAVRLPSITPSQPRNSPLYASRKHLLPPILRSGIFFLNFFLNFFTTSTKACFLAPDPFPHPLHLPGAGCHGGGWSRGATKTRLQDNFRRLSRARAPPKHTPGLPEALPCAHTTPTARGGTPNPSQTEPNPANLLTHTPPPPSPHPRPTSASPIPSTARRLPAPQRLRRPAMATPPKRRARAQPPAPEPGSESESGSETESSGGSGSEDERVEEVSGARAPRGGTGPAPRPSVRG